MNQNLIIAVLVLFIVYRIFSPLIKGLLSYKGFRELLDSDNPPLVLDVRTASEYKYGHISGAVNIPHDKLPKGMAKKYAKKDRKIVVYCQSGSRSGVAQQALKSAGYSDVQNFGAVGRWKESLVS